MNIPNIIENQKIVFFIQHLKQYFMLLGNQNLAKEIPIQPFFYHILEEIKTNPAYLSIDLVSVYYYAVQLFLDKENNIAFEKLRQLIVKQSPILTHTEWANLAFALRNYANEQKSFDASFELIHFELYFEHLPLGFVFSNNHISPQTFVSIVKIGAELGKIDKIRGFFGDYQAYLPIEIKHNTLLLAESYLLFEDKLYDASLQKLHLLEKFEHYTFELDMRMLKIQNACVLKETQFCLQQVNTFRVYIHR